MSLLDEINTKCTPQEVAALNFHAIADKVSAGRTRSQTRMISERGVRATLGPVNGAKLLATLKSLFVANETQAVPAWLTAVLTAMAVPTESHVYYLDTLACGWEWIRTDAGLDIGDATTQGMLDLIAAGNPDLAPAIATLKALAVVPDPVTWQQCAEALGA